MTLRGTWLPISQGKKPSKNVQRMAVRPGALHLLSLLSPHQDAEALAGTQMRDVDPKENQRKRVSLVHVRTGTAVLMPTGVLKPLLSEEVLGQEGRCTRGQLQGFSARKPA